MPTVPQLRTKPWGWHVSEVSIDFLLIFHKRSSTDFKTHEGYKRWPTQREIQGQVIFDRAACDGRTMTSDLEKAKVLRSHTPLKKEYSSFTKNISFKDS